MTKKAFLRAVGKEGVVPAGVAATGGVAANQFPQNQRSSKKAKEKLKDDVFKSDNEFANKMYNLVSKMDDDEAEMFAYLVVGDYLDELIEKNQRTLQRHLDEVISKRIERIRKSVLTSVSKMEDPKAVDYAKALTLIEKAVQWDKDEHPRGRGGRFSTKVHIAEDAGPLTHKQAQSRGIPNLEKENQNYRLGAKNRAQFHQEHQQIADFLSTVAAGGNLGDNDVHLTVENKFTGRRHTVKTNGKPKAGPNGDWNPRSERVVQLDAFPAGLTAGGAAFGLSNALGRPMSEQSVGVLNNANDNFTAFSRDWNNGRDTQNSNAGLYHNVNAASTFLHDTAPNGSAVKVAGRLGQVVGSRGPEAEKVFGPHARRTAYRYRGTERTPDPDLTRAYDSAVARATTGRPTSEQTRARTAAFNRAVTRARKEKAARTNTPEDAVQLTRAERAHIMNTLPKETTPGTPPEARGAGREAVHTYLQNRVETLNRNLYRLHLDAGNTPPSEGVIIDKDGKIVAQAIGYGDDHYLPFNLKNLKKLRGGEYMRTRSVGGPTAEDIYTGLMAGAQKITVVSRSGTFTVDFADDFKGGRRYNDKAGRMVSRYKQILDSVQSETVDSRDVPPMVRAIITNRVKERSKGFPAADIKRAIDQEINDLKANPDFSEDFPQEDIDREINRVTAGMTEGERNHVAGQLRGDARKAREFKFKLNGEGYEAALTTLEEQFPYYIKTDYQPRKDPEGFSPEKDSGYVEPGRNRPTQARAGWHGVKNVSGASGSGNLNQGTKFSASHADYQRGIYGEDARPTTSNTSTTQGQQATGQGEGQAQQRDAQGNLVPRGGTNGTVAARIADHQEQLGHIKAALAVHKELKPLYDGATAEIKRSYPLIGLDEAVLKERLKTPTDAREFDKQVTALLAANPDVKLTDQVKVDYERAVNRIGRTRYEYSAALVPNAKPFLFSGEAYLPGANPSVVERESNRLDEYQPVTGAKKLSQMDEAELKLEIDMLASLDDATKQFAPTDGIPEKVEVLERLGIPVTEGSRKLAADPKKIEVAVRTVQQRRTMNLNNEANRGRWVGATEPLSPEEAANDQEKLRNLQYGQSGVGSPPATPAQPMAPAPQVPQGQTPPRQEPAGTMHPAARTPGDVTDHRDRLKGAHDQFVHYRDNLMSRNKPVPEYLNRAIADANNTMTAKSIIDQSDFTSWLSSDEYKQSAEHMMSDMRDNPEARDGW